MPRGAAFCYRFGENCRLGIINVLCDSFSDQNDVFVTPWVSLNFLLNTAELIAFGFHLPAILLTTINVENR